MSHLFGPGFDGRLTGLNEPPVLNRVVIVVYEKRRDRSQRQNHQKYDIHRNREEVSAEDCVAAVRRCVPGVTMTVTFVVTEAVVVAVIPTRIGLKKGFDRNTILINTHRVCAAFGAVGHQTRVYDVNAEVNHCRPTDHNLALVRNERSR